MIIIVMRLLRHVFSPANWSYNYLPKGSVGELKLYFQLTIDIFTQERIGKKKKIHYNILNETRLFCVLLYASEMKKPKMKDITKLWLQKSYIIYNIQTVTMFNSCFRIL